MMREAALLANLFVLAFIMGCTALPEKNFEKRSVDSSDCISLKGRIVNTISYPGGSCMANETDAGTVEGMLCPCICCVPMKNDG